MEVRLIEQLLPSWVVRWQNVPTRRLLIEAFVNAASIPFLRFRVQTLPDWEPLVTTKERDLFIAHPELEDENIVTALARGEATGVYAQQEVMRLAWKYVFKMDPQPIWFDELLPSVARYYRELRFGP